ncbi:crotonase/enoyl-CoA hydratase family protein [Agrobacterium sp. Azo12]|uniref:crotonase/enoyl-CoA hydratase family protein n=1 Tax=Agrobacterium sp. Azo12 TaxID=3031129 RepID=UPI0023D823D2|nr:crotonase/enoyl-CoA hydratase family protein [Agrobacterium sp. Azo12]MDO5894683.1 crotonase/enoyl-CoA hydratase family protein [Agrobacterium sp. Azo12]
MQDNHILVERSEDGSGVLVIRFNRPEKKNAITQAMYRRMVKTLNSANEDEGVRVVVFLGTEGCFSAGNDMADFLTYGMGQAVEPPAGFEFIKALAEAKKPLVSGVDGLAIGIGTTLHLHCDMTVASSRSLFKTPFVDLALVPEAASSLLAPRVMGHQRAFALLVAGEGFSAKQAFEAGLIWKVTEPENVETETLEIARKLAAKPPQALRIARDLLRGSEQEKLQRMDEEFAHFSSRLKSAEARAAFEAFMRR